MLMPLPTQGGLVPAVPAMNAGTAAGTAPKPGPPVYTELVKVYTVRDVWRDWTEGLAGRPAVRELEEAWGSRWRPGNIVRV